MSSIRYQGVSYKSDIIVLSGKKQKGHICVSIIVPKFGFKYWTFCVSDVLRVKRTANAVKQISSGALGLLESYD